MVSRWLVGTVLVGGALAGAVAGGFFLRADGESTHAGVLRVPDCVELPGAPYGAVVPYEIEVRNEGPGAIAIVEVATNCGCTTVARAPFVIGSGESRTITGEFETAKRLTAEESSSVVTLRTERGDAHQVRLRAPLVKPLPDRGTPVEGRLTLDLNAHYAEIVESIVCYPDTSNTPLEVEAVGAREGIEVRGIPEGAATIQAVLRIWQKESSRAPYEIFQEVSLDSPVENALRGMAAGSP